jgi:hypothetical protein
MTDDGPSDGGWTMNWRGMVMRCGEHVAQTTLPHFLQWCFLYKNVKILPHTGQRDTSASGCHCGRSISLTLLNGPGFEGLVLLVVGKAGSGRADMAAGDESSTIGSELELPALFECILMPDGRRKGESAVVSRLLRSELCEDDESERGGGRFGSVHWEGVEVGCGWGLDC